MDNTGSGKKKKSLAKTSASASSSETPDRKKAITKKARSKSEERMTLTQKEKAHDNKKDGHVKPKASGTKKKVLTKTMSQEEERTLLQRLSSEYKEDDGPQLVEAPKKDRHGLPITISVHDFTDAIMMSLGGEPSHLCLSVAECLINYHQDPSKVTRDALWKACAEWYATATTKRKNEFEKDDLSHGVFRKLAVQAGIDLARPRDPPAVKFMGNRYRIKAKTRIPPDVILLDNTIVKTLKEHIKVDRKVAIIVIDLYDNDMAGTGLDKKFPDKRGTPTNEEQIKTFLAQTNDLTVYICDKKRKVQDRWVASHPGRELIKRFDECIPGGATKKTVYSDTLCVAKGTLGLDSQRTLLDDLNETGITDLFVTGFDANACVAASIFGTLKTDGTINDRGFCDHGFHVVTSRCILGAGGQEGHLEASVGWPYMGPCTKGS